jgi:hypothetical protein
MLGRLILEKRKIVEYPAVLKCVFLATQDEGRPRVVGHLKLLSRLLALRLRR